MWQVREYDLREYNGGSVASYPSRIVMTDLRKFTALLVANYLTRTTSKGWFYDAEET